MDRSRGSPLAPTVSPIQIANKPESASRLRRKLQKGVPRPKGYPTKRPGSGASNEDCNGNKFDTAVKLVTHQAGAIGHPSIPLPPDLSDSKWLEYIRKSGLLCSVDPTAQTKDTLDIPITVPELSHLTVKDAEPRASLDTMSAESSASSASTISTMRRRAKTPVFSIGQLEGDFSFGRQTDKAGKTSSVELIAEQYRALLDARDTDSIYSDALSEPAPSRLGFREDEHELRRQHSSSALPIEAQQRQNGSGPARSPTSDDGTLVAFDEETIYFKPMSFSPEPFSPESLSPIFSYESPSPRSQTPQDNLSLQICLDLLTRELSSAISERPRRVGNDTSALQIWVMIEAYERLRDQVADMRLQTEETRCVEVMFDTWLRALYTIHDSLTEDTRVSESNYDASELEEEPLD